MKYFLFLIIFFLYQNNSFALSCCGEVSIKAQKLIKIYDSSDVEHLWKNGVHIDWLTGITDPNTAYNGPDIHSHCSAFVAAITKKINISILRPPEHPETFLASAQAKWLRDQATNKNSAWIKLSSMKEAQTLANQGEFVIAVFESKKAKKPGHIAIVRGADKDEQQLMEEGPQIIQAGKFNYQSTTLKEGFKNHKNAFPNEIEFYSHQYSE